MAKKRYGRIILSWLFAIIMMISNILPAFATGSADSQSLKIKVTVVNASDENQYLEGNGITLKSLFSSYEETKYTDEKGSVEFTGLALENTRSSTVIPYRDGKSSPPHTHTIFLRIGVSRFKKNLLPRK